MSKRLQVLLEEKEILDLRSSARSSGMTVAEWVRQAIRAARARETAGNSADKLSALDRASRHAFPTADIDEMLVEIESGYREH